MSEPDRGNGLRAASYVPLVDLTFELADTVLDALRDAGVAAYVTPTAPADPSGTPAAERPTSWLYVDAEAEEQAKHVLGRFTRTSTDGTEPAPGTDEEQGTTGEEAIWEQIVASYDEPPPGESPPWPARENLDEDDHGDRSERDAPGKAEERPLTESRSSGVRVVRPAETSGADEDDGSADLDNEDEHFVPPTPPPLPHLDTLTKVAWGALFGGPGYLLLAAMLGWDVPGWAAFVAVAAFVGGFVTLVIRMGDTPPDSGSDDGAVV